MTCTCTYMINIILQNFPFSLYLYFVSNVGVSLVISSNAVDIFIFNISFNKTLIIHGQNVTNVDVDFQLR